MSKDSFCALPFMHLNIMPDGDAHPCCTSPHPLTDNAGNPLNIRTHSLPEIWHSEALHDLRKRMILGERPRHCMGCYQAEDAGFESVRTNYNRMILHSDSGSKSEFTGFTQISRAAIVNGTQNPTYFDLRFDNVCNLKCVMCFASESSSIEADPVQTAWTGEQRINRTNRFDNAKKWVASDRLYDELKQIGEDAQYIRFAGGEPFRSALALKWMDYLGKSGKAKNITLQFYTNLQLLNERIINLLAPFKYISFVLSIDGTGDTYEYIRHPGKWDRVEKNCRLLANAIGRRLPAGHATINATMSIPGAMRIREVFAFGESLGFGVTLSNAVHPAHVSTRYLPEASKRRLESDLREYAIKHPMFSNLPSEVNQWMADIYSATPSDAGHGEAMLNAMRFINDMDRTRGLDFKRLQPDLVADFALQTGAWIDETRYAGRMSDDVTAWSIDQKRLVIDKQEYSIVGHVGGSVEGCDELRDSFVVTGWASDMRNKRAARGVVAVIGGTVVAVTHPRSPRVDIAKAFGESTALAGFSLVVPKLGNRPTLDEPIRFYALADGAALPLAAAFDGAPIAHVVFSTDATLSRIPTTVFSTIGNAVRSSRFWSRWRS